MHSVISHMEHGEVYWWCTLPFHIGWWHQSSAITWPASPQSVWCGSLWQQQQQQQQQQFWRREEQEVALRHVLNKLGLERDVHRSAPHCWASVSVLLQCVWDQTDGRTAGADELVTSTWGGRRESFPRRKLQFYFWFLFSSDQTSRENQEGESGRAKNHFNHWQSTRTCVSPEMDVTFTLDFRGEYWADFG